MKKLILASIISLSLSAQTITLKEGWNLLGAIEDLKIDTNSNCINKIFTYQNGVWSNLEDIKQGSGFWAYAQSGCILNTSKNDKSSRGKLINSEFLSTITKREIDFVLLMRGYNINTEYDVEIYKVLYSTIDTKGDSTNLTAIISIPKGVSEVAILSYQHGTLHTKSNAPSMLNDETKSIASLSSTNGFATVMSDYLGYNTEDGATNKLHPYHLKEPTISATLDLLKASKEFLAQKGIDFNNQLFLSGYSEGGYATMALDNELSKNDEFNVTASAPMAGAYDINYTANYFITSDEEHPNPLYFPFVVLAYNNYYEFTDNPKDFFVDEYKHVVDIFDNLESYTWEGINAELNPIVKKMFNLNDEKNSYKEFKDELEPIYVQNSVYKYIPEGKVRLYHCKGDKDVPYQNSVIAYEYLKDKGDVELVDIKNSENLDHQSCATPSAIDAINWFLELKK